MEVELVAVSDMNRDAEGMGGFFLGLEIKILRVHAEECILQKGDANRVGADRWRPLMTGFRHFYGLSTRLQASRLAEIDERNYRWDAFLR